MKSKSALLVVAGLAVVAGWYFWPDGKTEGQGGAPSSNASPTGAGEAPVPAAMEPKGAEEAVSKVLPPPVVVDEPPGPPPRELPRDEPRQTKWGTLSLRPPEETPPAR